jgi:hypothetical protein
MRTVLILVLCIPILWSCQEEIKLTLDSAAPKPVIYGQITDSTGARVNLSLSGAYYDNNTFTALGADYVVLSDNTGAVDTLTEDSTGYYSSTTINGSPGRTYTLKVTISGTEYSATCPMLPAVKPDSLGIRPPTNPINVDERRIHCFYHDEPGVKNFYLINIIRNDTLLSNYRIINDNFRDGKQIEQRLGGVSFYKGDKAVILLSNISENVYNYLFELQQVTSGNSFNAVVAPANPDSPFGLSALGYFNAFAPRKISIIVQ